ncbi:MULTISPECIES: hypothetical protein [Streptomyces]|uniref:hypothetical protein n=1 Tax=Streptomyces TaxID=1883 RepID=UPI001B3914E4|nr:hypothetical protein [Streptomyces sp. B15]MBQ1119197.1 hypothetical protein [Streptomyces sp. B15]
MGDTSRSHRNNGDIDDASSESEDKKPEEERVERGPLPGRNSDRFDEGPPDPLASLLAKVNNGEAVPVPGGKAGSEDRDLQEEEWRPHDRNGPYGQRRRRKN